MRRQTVLVSLSPDPMTITCPICGHVNELKWEGNQLIWWPVAGQCTHYEGSYHVTLSTVEARFWGIGL